jgi:hypothetical protein
MWSRSDSNTSFCLHLGESSVLSRSGVVRRVRTKQKHNIRPMWTIYCSVIVARKNASSSSATSETKRRPGSWTERFQISLDVGTSPFGTLSFNHRTPSPPEWKRITQRRWLAPNAVPYLKNQFPILFSPFTQSLALVQQQGYDIQQVPIDPSQMVNRLYVPSRSQMSPCTLSAARPERSS